MKKINLIILLAISVSSAIFAQNADDALRYSRIFYNGTARFTSMGGAFTALGGDISSLSQNPAGLGVFRSSSLTITPQLGYFKAKSVFNNSNSEDYLYNFGLGQVGLVANIRKNDSGSGLVSLNFAYSYNRTNNLNQSITINGISNTSSLADYWADEAEGYFKDELASNAADAYLAWSTWVIDSLSHSNTSYGTAYSNYGDNPPSVYGQNMKRTITNTGYTGEHAISVGGNYDNKLFFGATLGINTLYYESQYVHSESTDLSLPSKLTDFVYTLYRKDKGTGLNLKFGVIYKPIEMLRLGLAFHSPTVYHIDEYINDNISTHYSDGGHPEASNDPTRFSYGLATPFRVLAGAAVQIGKLASFSADYEFVDYGSSRFFETGDGYDYTAKNQAIKNDLGPSSNIRLGGEVRLNSLYLRGGYGYYGKSWKTGTDNQNLDYSSLSCGLGFREKNIFVDFGYSTLANKEKYILYSSSVGSAVSDLNQIRNTFTLTFGYNFGY